MTSKKFKQKFDRFLKEWIYTLGIALVVAFFFRTTIASPRHIPTGSMIPTIKIGEFIFVKMFAFDWHVPYTRKSLSPRRNPERGEVVVFEFPHDSSKDYIKRIIAVPGDTLEIRDGRVILNGTPLPIESVEDKSILEDLAPKYDPDHLSLFRETNNGHSYYVMHIAGRASPDMAPIKIPENSYFAMGDNRDDSYDSRFWGPVPREKFLGTGVFTWFSVDIHHFPFLRFSRFFRPLN